LFFRIKKKPTYGRIWNPPLRRFVLGGDYFNPSVFAYGEATSCFAAVNLINRKAITIKGGYLFSCFVAVNFNNYQAITTLSCFAAVNLINCRQQPTSPIGRGKKLCKSTLGSPEEER